MSTTILRRGDAGYEDARLAAVWNGRKPDRFPDAIALAREAEDVVEAVRLARERGWRIGVRSGGHSWSGNAIRDGGLLLDMSGLEDFEIDTEGRTAWSARASGAPISSPRSTNVGCTSRPARAARSPSPATRSGAARPSPARRTGRPRMRCARSTS